jgi:hypothetical protein
LTIESVETSAETIVTVLESITNTPSVNTTEVKSSLVVMNGQHLDTVKGSLRLGLALQKAIKRDDILVLAIQHLNTRKVVNKENPDSNLKENRVRKFTHYSEDGMASGTDYGLGSSNFSGNEDEDDCLRLQKNSSSLEENEFEVSVQAICGKLDLTREEVCSGLYRLQQQGVLSYSLQDPAIYIDVSANAFNEFKQWMNFSTDEEIIQGSLTTWLSDLTSKVYDRLETVNQDNYIRCLDMWRVGQIMRHTIVEQEYNNHDDNDDMKLNSTSKDMQSNVQELLSIMLDSGIKKKSLNSEISSKVSILEEMFLETLPLTTLIDSKISKNMDETILYQHQLSEKEQSSCERDILTLRQHPQLIELIETMMRQYCNSRVINKNRTDNMSSQSIVKNNRLLGLELYAHCITKILQGLNLTPGVSALSRNDNNGGNTQWAGLEERYRHIHFFDLREFALNVLIQLSN